MTRKHFKELANAIKYATVDDASRREMAEEISVVCYKFNPNFDKYRFLEACGVEQFFQKGAQ